MRQYAQTNSHVFSEYHDRRFAQQDSIGVKPWSSVRTRRFGVSNVAQSMPVLRILRRRAIVAGDTLAAAQLGIRATPAILVDGILFSGSPGKDTLAVYIKRALVEK